MRPRYLRGDFILAAAVAVGTGTLAYWLPSLGVNATVALFGYLALLWLVADVLHRRIVKEFAAQDQRSLAKRIHAAGHEIIVWPPLPSDPIVRGRPANAKDVRKGKAVFVMHDVTGKSGRPVDIDLPQYGWIDETPVAVIQAETDGTSTFLGVFDLESGSVDFHRLDEVKLLGRETPK